MSASAGTSAAADVSLLLEAFLEMLAAERGAALNTLDAYRSDIADFSRFLATRGATLSAASSGDLKAYLDALDRRGMVPSTAARRLSALRRFFAFLYGEGHRADNPADRLEAPRRRQRLPKILSEHEVTRLLEVAATAAGMTSDKATRAGHEKALRRHALVALLYASGLRVSELVSLPAGAVQPDRRFLHVRGKGGKERLVPLTAEALEAVMRYRAVRTPAASPWLFPSHAQAGHLTRQQFALILKDLAVEAGIPPARLSPHTVRHAFATHLLAHGADLRAVQKMLGHSDISTTQIYTHVLDARKQALVQNRHPLARTPRPALKRAGEKARVDNPDGTD